MSAARFPSLDHLVAMTDDVGIFQHARHDIPDRHFGYCTDDVSRALIVAVEAARNRSTEATAARLVATYLGFLRDAQLNDGWFHNFMGYDRRWQDRRGTEDAFGRALWGLGRAAARAPKATWGAVAREMFDRALPHAAGLPHVRSRAYAALGILALADEAPEPWLLATLRGVVAPIADAYRATSSPAWDWCEDVMTYDNARLCEVLIRAGRHLGDAAILDAGLAMFRFLASIVVEDGIFVPIGNDGWYPRGGVRARFGQQPLDAAAFVDAALAVYALTGDAGDRALAEIGGAWFTGRNSHGVPVVSGAGCRDGLDATGPSENMGAESTVSALMCAIALTRAGRAALRLAR